MMKKTRIIIASALVLLSAVLMTSCGGKSGETGTVTDPGAADSSENSNSAAEEQDYIYKSDNYTVDGYTATASKIAADSSEMAMGTVIYDFPEAGAENSIYEAHVSFDSAASSAGIIFQAAESTDYDGFSGYAFMLRDRRVYLYELTGSSFSGMITRELGVRVVERPKSGEGAWLRVVRDGNTYRMYFLDDAEDIEPWPEFEFVLTGGAGSGVGYIDNGQGAAFDSLSVSTYDAPEKSAAETYKNPVYSATQAADPGVLKYNGKYYCYSTSAAIGYLVYESDDLVNWENKGQCCGEVWGIDKGGYYWAPEVVMRNDKFYMIMSVDEHLGFATSDSPLGPFVPEESWLFDDTIDGHVFIDDDGRAYLYYVSWRSGHEYGIYGCELSEDLLSVKEGTEVLLIKPESPWEKAEGGVTEGPFMLKYDGTYYLTYSGTGYTSWYYAVGYATSDKPLGEFAKYSANPVLSYTTKVYGPGHHSFTESPDGSELIIVYHAHKSSTEIHPRVLCIDRARFGRNKNGEIRLEIWGPTHTAEEYPH